MFNKYLIIAIGVLSVGCISFYHLWDSTKIELNQVRAEKVTLEQEIKRRNENEKNLSKRISELSKLYSSNAGYFDTPIPDDIIMLLHKSCKACK